MRMAASCLSRTLRPDPAEPANKTGCDGTANISANISILMDCAVGTNMIPLSLSQSGKIKLNEPVETIVEVLLLELRPGALDELDDELISTD